MEVSRQVVQDAANLVRVQGMAASGLRVVAIGDGPPSSVGDASDGPAEGGVEPADRVADVYASLVLAVEGHGFSRMLV